MVTPFRVTHLHKIAQDCPSSNTFIIANSLILTNFHLPFVAPEGF